MISLSQTIFPRALTRNLLVNLRNYILDLLIFLDILDLLDLLELLNLLDILDLLAFLDLLKAYDSVDRPTLWRKLAEMGFGGKFLRCLQALYEGDYVTCQVGGLTTRLVFLGRGLRQGCSL